jgi:hypothetical protein
MLAAPAREGGQAAAQQESVQHQHRQQCQQLWQQLSTRRLAGLGGRHAALLAKLRVEASTAPAGASAAAAQGLWCPSTSSGMAGVLAQLPAALQARHTAAGPVSGQRQAGGAAVLKWHKVSVTGDWVVRGGGGGRRCGCLCCLCTHRHPPHPTQAEAAAAQARREEAASARVAALRSSDMGSYLALLQVVERCCARVLLCWLQVLALSACTCPASQRTALGRGCSRNTTADCCHCFHFTCTGEQEQSAAAGAGRNRRLPAAPGGQAQGSNWRTRAGGAQWRQRAGGLGQPGGLPAC